MTADIAALAARLCSPADVQEIGAATAHAFGLAVVDCVMHGTLDAAAVEALFPGDEELRAALMALPRI